MSTTILIKCHLICTFYCHEIYHVASRDPQTLCRPMTLALACFSLTLARQRTPILMVRFGARQCSRSPSSIAEGLSNNIKPAMITVNAVCVDFPTFLIFNSFHSYSILFSLTVHIILIWLFLDDFQVLRTPTLFICNQKTASD